MITLRKRLSVHDRVGKVTVIYIMKPTLEDVDYLITKFKRTGYLKICDEVQKSVDLLNNLDGKIKNYIVVDEETNEYKFYQSGADIMKDYKSFEMFTKKDRSSFKYWFAHWCGFQIIALNIAKASREINILHSRQSQKHSHIQRDAHLPVTDPHIAIDQFISGHSLVLLKNPVKRSGTVISRLYLNRNDSGVRLNQKFDLNRRSIILIKVQIPVPALRQNIRHKSLIYTTLGL